VPFGSWRHPALWGSALGAAILVGRGAHRELPMINLMEEGSVANARVGPRPRARPATGIV
jgi:hypothetical protein